MLAKQEKPGQKVIPQAGSCHGRWGRVNSPKYDWERGLRRSEAENPKGGDKSIKV
jgi:hypothetical protein